MAVIHRAEGGSPGGACAGLACQQDAALTCAGTAAQGLTRQFSITYGTGAVTGRVGYDTVTLGDANAISIPSQGFGQVMASSSDFTTASCDGLFVRAPPNSPCSPPGRDRTRVL